MPIDTGDAKRSRIRAARKPTPDTGSVLRDLVKLSSEQRSFHTFRRPGFSW
ncbi:hypothetical protein [Nocardia sp. AB354]|uniref:hypothetical protein n=1 Tax=Nocardia sp. AB354 TaxID=3413283 RepID=UPI003C262DF4